MSALVQIKPTSVTHAGSVSISTNGTITFGSSTSYIFNGIFSADYRKYLFVCEYVTGLASDLYCDLSLNGTPTGSATGYQYDKIDYYTTSFDAGRTSNIPAFVKSGQQGQQQGFVMTITDPFLAGPTVARSDFICMYSSSHPVWGGNRTWHHNLNTSYNGLQMYSGYSFSGILQIYGFKE